MVVTLLQFARRQAIAYSRPPPPSTRQLSPGAPADRRVVAGARADLENAVTRRDIEQFGHGDHDPDLAGRADGAPFAVVLRNDGVAAVNTFERDIWKEHLARDRTECVFDRGPELEAATLQTIDHQATDLTRVGNRHGAYSHSIVAGGFDETSYTTRFTPGTSLTMRAETRSRRSYGRRAQSAVMKSSVVTARSATSAP